MGEIPKYNYNFRFHFTTLAQISAKLNGFRPQNFLRLTLIYIFKVHNNISQPLEVFRDQ
jgi:hypothetical protein